MSTLWYECGLDLGRSLLNTNKWLDKDKQLYVVNMPYH